MNEASRLSLRAMGISERAARDSLRVPDFLYIFNSFVSKRKTRPAIQDSSPPRKLLTRSSNSSFCCSKCSAFNDRSQRLGTGI